MFNNVKPSSLIRKVVTLFLLAMTAVMFSSTAFSVESLRGSSELDSKSNKAQKHKVTTVSGGIQRNYKLQPPLVPHTVDKYRISLKDNGCLRCHSKKTHKKEKAPMVGESHFIGRDGKVNDTISSRRYFCNQCHAPQVGSNPLVENTYEGI